LRNNGVDNAQGRYTSGVIMMDAMYEETADNHDLDIKFNRTTVVKYPWALERVVNTKDGFTSETKNLSWDFYSGVVDQTLAKSSLGLHMKTVTKPAYAVYSALGPKAVDITNKNMLSQSAAIYSYVSDAVGNNLGLTNASIQTWTNLWSNYRYYNGTSYSETPEEVASSSNRVWRKDASYVWVGEYARRQDDGSQRFTTTDEFVFGSTNPLYRKTSQYLRFDHYGMPLETVDENLVPTAVKMGYDQRTIIASASNASYKEIAFSSAEDLDASSNFFGGEVQLGSASVVKKSSGANVHTGDCAISLSAGTGFIYKPTGLKTNKTYRASVWSNSTNGRLYYILNGTQIVSLAPTAASEGKTGWYQINLEIPIQGTFTSLEVGVKSESGTVVFDDFRFQPVTSRMICYVYAPLDYAYLAGWKTETWTLDNDNLFTRSEISEDGRINRNYVESIKLHREVLANETKSDFRRFHINQ
jgi:hypothetical protein